MSCQRAGGTDDAERVAAIGYVLAREHVKNMAVTFAIDLETADMIVRGCHGLVFDRDAAPAPAWLLCFFQTNVPGRTAIVRCPKREHVLSEIHHGATDPMLNSEVSDP